MKLIESIQDMQALAADSRRAGKKIGLVPTMGFLHEGHASLMREGRKRSDLLVTSIFVNPTQFGAGEDFETYPRDLDRDTKVAAAAGVDVMFLPKASAMYPRSYQTYVNVEQITLPLCGANRPGHFRGVSTVVCKLFNIVMPDVALFGKKDFQQLAVIRQMVADLNMSVEIIGMPIVREADGLAMSSRNAYLSARERIEALCLSEAIRSARAAYGKGTTKVEALREVVRASLGKAPSAMIDYVEFRDSTTLEEVTSAGDSTLLALAVKIGKTRLIDNTLLGEE